MERQQETDVTIFPLLVFQIKNLLLHIKKKIKIKSLLILSHWAAVL